MAREAGRSGHGRGGRGGAQGGGRREDSSESGHHKAVAQQSTRQERRGAPRPPITAHTRGGPWVGSRGRSAGLCPCSCEHPRGPLRFQAGRVCGGAQVHARTPSAEGAARARREAPAACTASTCPLRACLGGFCPCA